MQTKQQDKESNSTPIYLQFNKLPKLTQELIKKRLNGELGDFFYHKSNNIVAYILCLFALVWCGILFYLADDYLWKTPKLIFYSFISFLAFYLFFHSLFSIYNFLKSTLKTGILVTSHYIIDCNFNELKFWDMEKLYSINCKHNYSSGSYQSTHITLSLENGSKSFQIKNLSEAEEVVEQIENQRKLYIEAIARNDEDYLNSAQDFIELKNAVSTSPKTSANFLSYVLIGLFAVLTTVGVMFGASSANNYFDDKRNWNDALLENRASSYRKYLQTYPNGRWSNDSSQNLQGLYENAEKKYQESLNKGFDPNAVEAVKQAIRYAKDTKNYKVKIVYERHNEIPSDIIKILKDYYEVKKLLSFGDSFSDEKITQREQILSAKIAEAVNVVIPNDILEFSNDCNDECIVFLVKYTFDSDTIYYSLLEEKVPEKERLWMPAVWFDWNFNIKTPNTPKPYKFEFESNPSKNINNDSKLDESDVGKESFDKKMEAEKSLFYDAVVESAFEDFKANLIYRMGIGEKPKDNLESEPEVNESAQKNKTKTK